MIDCQITMNLLFVPLDAFDPTSALLCLENVNAICCWTEHAPHEWSLGKGNNAQIATHGVYDFHKCSSCMLIHIWVEGEDRK